MLKRAIVFIDGNNFYHCVKRFGIQPNQIDYLKLSEFVCSKFNLNRQKTIYYNSIPDIRDGAEKYYKHLSFLSEIESLPKFEVKKRKLQKQSNKEALEEKEQIITELNLCNKCKPKVKENCLNCIGNISKKEKGIDVWLAVDMIDKALKDEYDFAVLIAGDADFIPALNLIKENGKQIKSAFIRTGYSSNIRKTFPNDFLYLEEKELIKNCLKTSKFK